MASTSSIPYRPAIDGLRAVAVLAVFIFHLNHKWLPGGFVGVDVFFVISGYLITSVLLREYERGSFSLWKFYQRRIARLFPAFVTVALATFIGACLIYSSRELASCGLQLITSTLSVANMNSMLQGGYFTVAPDSTPFLHCWSLSVEEQFYLLFPMCLLLLYLKANRHMPAVMAVVGVASLLGCIVLTQLKPEFAFYLLPTRAWELLAGSILAVLHPAPSLLDHRKFWAGLSVSGLALILLSFFVINESMPFPGYIAVLPVLGTLFLIGPPPGGSAERFLSWSPLVLIGKMSYSLYLWHWPIFSLVDYKLYLAPPLVRLGLKIGLSIVTTACCYYWIEKPGRTYLNQPQKRPVAFGFLIGTVALFVLLGVLDRKANFISADARAVTQGGLVFNPAAKNGSILLMGDSNGSMYGIMARAMAYELGLKLTVLSMAGGDALPHSDGINSFLWTDSLAVAKGEKPDFILLVVNWCDQLKDDKNKLPLAVGALKPYTHCLILITQPPTLPENATREAMRDGVRPPFFENPAYRAKRKDLNAYVKSFQGDGVIVVNIDPYFEADDGSVVFFDKEGHEVYYDFNHLSEYGAELVKPNVLKALLSQKPALRSGP